MVHNRMHGTMIIEISNGFSLESTGSFQAIIGLGGRTEPVVLLSSEIKIKVVEMRDCTK